MKGLLKGIGMGAAMAGALLIPLPVLLLGVVIYFAPKTKEETPPEPRTCPLTAQEKADLIQFVQLIERAPSPQAAAALIEEFYL